MDKKSSEGLETVLLYGKVRVVRDDLETVFREEINELDSILGNELIKEFNDTLSDIEGYSIKFHIDSWNMDSDEHQIFYEVFRVIVEICNLYKKIFGKEYRRADDA